MHHARTRVAVLAQRRVAAGMPAIRCHWLSAHLQYSWHVQPSVLQFVDCRCNAFCRPPLQLNALLAASCSINRIACWSWSTAGSCLTHLTTR